MNLHRRTLLAGVAVLMVMPMMAVAGESLPAPDTMVGQHLGRCVRDVLDGRVAVERVRFIFLNDAEALALDDETYWPDSGLLSMELMNHATPVDGARVRQVLAELKATGKLVARPEAVAAAGPDWVAYAPGMFALPVRCAVVCAG